jgi:hypothetical protein
MNESAISHDEPACINWSKGEASFEELNPYLEIKQALFRSGDPPEGLFEPINVRNQKSLRKEKNEDNQH